jgi:uncharacterized protein (DUF849 family)
VSEIEETIAKAIKKADSSYFFENYNKQAKAVLRLLDKEGYKVVPKLADPNQIEAGKAAISRGRVRPADFVHTLYAIMVAAGGK